MILQEDFKLKLHMQLEYVSWEVMSILLAGEGPTPLVQCTVRCDIPG